ncbi:MAG: DNA-protecting protein DprA [Acidobacteria bacterium]|nr:DNA-protecting protein DprA [Acidobacteriota bacterium]
MSTEVNEWLEWITLSLVTGVGSCTAARLLDYFETPGNVLTASRAALESFGLKEDLIGQMQSPEPRRAAEEELKKIEAMKAEVLVLNDPRYPALLKEVYDAPLVLYGMGNFDQVFSQPTVAMVGTRQPSTYGMNAATQLARDLATRGVVIVSGFARGIDGAAHRGALEADGRTVAVLGTGLDVAYPWENRQLAEAIRENGALVTEFTLGTPPVPHNFPFRNRIISGLSLGVIVVEAAPQSGSLITARLALEQNREIFAVPGNITSSKSFGPNYLIKEGAKLIQTWRDVVEELPYEIKRKILVNETEPDATATQPTLVLSENETKVVGLLSTDAPVHIDELLIGSGLASSELMRVLLDLEIKDVIKQLPGKNFVKKL